MYEAEQDVLGPDEVVVQQARLFLGQHQHSSGSVGKALKQRCQPPQQIRRPRIRPPGDRATAQPYHCCPAAHASHPYPFFRAPAPSSVPTALPSVRAPTGHQARQFGASLGLASPKAFSADGGPLLSPAAGAVQRFPVSGLRHLPGASSYFTTTLTYRLVMNVWELLYLPGLDESLARVEAELRQAVASPEPLLTEVASHLVDAGGKRLRPALLLAAAGLDRVGRRERASCKAPSRWSWSTWARSTTTTSSTKPAPGGGSRASMPAGATSWPSWPATSCWPGRRRSPPAWAPRWSGCWPAPSGGSARAR